MSRKAAKAGHAQNAVADFQPFDPLSDSVDLACDLPARRKGARRFHLVHVLDNQRIGKVETRRADADTHLLLAGLGGLHLGQLQGFRAAGFMA